MFCPCVCDPMLMYSVRSWVVCSMTKNYVLSLAIWRQSRRGQFVTSLRACLRWQRYWTSRELERSSTTGVPTPDLWRGDSLQLKYDRCWRWGQCHNESCVSVCLSVCPSVCSSGQIIVWSYLLKLTRDSLVSVLSVFLQHHHARSASTHRRFFYIFVVFPCKNQTISLWDLWHAKRLCWSFFLFVIFLYLYLQFYSLLFYVLLQSSSALFGHNVSVVTANIAQFKLFCNKLCNLWFFSNNLKSTAV